MLKKFFLTSAICIVLAGGTAAASAAMQEAEQSPAVENATAPSTASESVEETSEAQDHLTAREKFDKEEKAKDLKEKDSFGGALTLISMGIVLLALIVLSILFLGFGKISSKILSKKKQQARGITDEPAAADDHDSGEVFAAIAMAIDEHFGGKHDIENTILTLRRMKRAYSPWNSKIYNLRDVPQVKHHHARISPMKNLK